MEERLVDVRPPLIAHRQPAILAQPRQRTLHHPPVPSQLLARVDPTAGDAWGYIPPPQGLPAAGEVVGFVGVQLLRALARPSGFPTRPLGRLDAIHGLLQNLRVMDVCGAENYCERDTSSVCHNMALRVRLSLICRIRAGSLTPLLAGTLAESKEALSQSMRSASPRRSKSARCSSSHTPASCQSRKRRQQVDPDPQPISWGSISQGMPLLRTKTMPVRAARSSMRGLPPLGLGGSSGNSGFMISQSSSDTSSLLMPMSVTSTHQQVLQGSLSSKTTSSSVRRYRSSTPKPPRARYSGRASPSSNESPTISSRSSSRTTRYGRIHRRKNTRTSRRSLSRSRSSARRRCASGSPPVRVGSPTNPPSCSTHLLRPTTLLGR